VKHLLPESAGRARFGAFEFERKTGELRKHGIRIKLPDQSAEILEALVGRPGELITREELRERLWPTDTFVDFDHGLNNAINRLREALGDSADEPRFVETLPRRGYRLIAPVEIVPAAAPAGPVYPSSDERPDVRTAPEAVAEAPAAARGEPRLRKIWIAAAACAALIALLIGMNVRGWRSRVLGKSQAPRIHSIAVLPLDNLSGDVSQEYFADGMTDALITDLAQIGSLRVISRTSAMRYKGATKPLPQIARELNVDAVVEGSVTLLGHRVRITAQLIQASTDRHLWAHEYEGDLGDILSLQDNVARGIADEIQANLTPRQRARLAGKPSINPDAYQAYLRGRFYLAQRTQPAMEKAVRYFQEATEKDPRSALAYSGLAESYSLLGGYAFLPPDVAHPKAKAAAGKALELDPDLAEAMTALADLTDDPAETEKLFKKAIELNPNYATAHHWYARFLSETGRHQEAVAEINRARELDPLSLIINDNVGEMLFAAREFDKAVTQLRKSLEMEPNYPRTHLDLGVVYERKGMFDQAIAEFQKSRALGGENWPEMLVPLQQAYEASGYRGYYQTQLRLLKQRSERSYVSPVAIAFACARLGDNRQALAWLEKAYEMHLHLTSLKDDPSWDSLRPDPGFEAFIRRISPPADKSVGKK
jgi:TolB-like protein/DNA-binding winged helix-turn-helix (wHTH) protein/tetratricopeptide (TPR) repeat protein